MAGGRASDLAGRINGLPRGGAKYVEDILMMLSEETTVATSALPIAALRDHLRLGTGFADIGAQDAALEGYLRAAIAAIEGRTAKALIAREFKLVVSAWRRDPVQTFPISPVASVSALRLVDRAGDALVVDSARYRLMPDIGRPRLEAVGLFPAIAQGGQAEIEFTAGFGDWADVPLAHFLNEAVVPYETDAVTRQAAADGHAPEPATLRPAFDAHALPHVFQIRLQALQQRVDVDVLPRLVDFAAADKIQGAGDHVLHFLQVTAKTLLRAIVLEHLGAQAPACDG